MITWRELLVRLYLDQLMQSSIGQSAFGFRRFPSHGLLVVLTGFLVGCEQTATPGASAYVTGSVKWNNEPVTEGRVMFYSVLQGSGADGNLNEQGTFQLKEPLPPGDYVVTILPKQQSGSAIAAEKGDPASFVKTGSVIPKKYISSENSDLRAQLAAGPNTVDLVLEGK